MWFDFPSFRVLWTWSLTFCSLVVAVIVVVVVVVVVVNCCCQLLLSTVGLLWREVSWTDVSLCRPTLLGNVCLMKEAGPTHTSHTRTPTHALVARIPHSHTHLSNAYLTHTHTIVLFRQGAAGGAWDAVRGGSLSLCTHTSLTRTHTSHMHAHLCCSDRELPEEPGTQYAVEVFLSARTPHSHTRTLLTTHTSHMHAHLCCSDRELPEEPGTQYAAEVFLSARTPHSHTRTLLTHTHTVVLFRQGAAGGA